jgi:ABC-2 type transport system permease protein
MKAMIFAVRNFKEIIRDPMSIILGIGGPVAPIAMLSLVSRSIPGSIDLFEIQNFAPGMIVVGLSFLALFLGMLMTTDRNTSFLIRLFATPLTGYDYLAGYFLSMLPLALLQTTACLITAVLFGLPFDSNLLAAMVALLPAAILFVSLGLLLGSVSSTSGGMSAFGMVIIAGSVFLSGAIIPIDAMGGAFKEVCYLLPFVHANNAVKASLGGDYASVINHSVWVLGYALVIFGLAAILFKGKMKN